ncbi:hypothetical protein AWV80_40480 [Cupriavidus sp. UYMU48A]|nr:hypothetical protein AWV80_40480 [Cupriavidus sp. UYMU48A]
MASAPEAAAEGTSGFAQPGVLDLAHPSGPIRVLFDLGAHPALDIAAPPGGSRAPRPGDAARALRIAVASVLLEPLLKQLAALGLAGVHVTHLARDVTHASNEPDMLDVRDGAAFSMTFSVNGTRHSARVLPAAPVVDALEAWHAARTVRLPADALSQHASSQTQGRAWPLGGCRVPGRLILGSRRLPVDTLRALQPGAVLLRSLPGQLRALLPQVVRPMSSRPVQFTPPTALPRIPPRVHCSLGLSRADAPSRASQHRRPQAFTHEGDHHGR